MRVECLPLSDWRVKGDDYQCMRCVGFRQQEDAHNGVILHAKVLCLQAANKEILFSASTRDLSQLPLQNDKPA